MKYLKYISIIIICLIVSCSDPFSPLKSGKWHLQSDQEDAQIYNSIFFVDDSYGWIGGSGGMIKKSTDGGITWTPQNINSESSIWDIYFLDRKIGWASGSNNTIIKTIDGGANWFNCSIADSRAKTYLYIKFVNPSIGWCNSNYGEVYRTTDGGSSWQLKKKLKEMGAFLSVIDGNTAYLLQGALYKTYDGGRHWDSVDIQIPKNYFATSMSFVNGNSGLITTGNASGMMIDRYPVLFSSNGGKNWTSAGPLDNPGFMICFFVDENQAWVGGKYKIYQTNNGGRSWNESLVNRNDNEYLWCSDMSFINCTTGWIITIDGRVYQYRY